jgi:hypothetical protein
MAPFLTIKWYQGLGEACCLHLEVNVRTVTVVKMQIIVSSLETAAHGHKHSIVFIQRTGLFYS